MKKTCLFESNGGFLFDKTTVNNKYLTASGWNRYYRFNITSYMYVSYIKQVEDTIFLIIEKSIKPLIRHLCNIYIVYNQS